MNPKVLVVQKSAAKNTLADIASWIELGEKACCDIVIFPEYMNGVFMVEQYDHVATLSLKISLQQLAEKHHIALIASFLERIDNKYFNIAYYIGSTGAIKGTHKKIALTKYYEAHALTPGNEVCVIPTEFGNVGIMICRDMFYPQITERLVAQGAQIIFCPCYWAYDSTEYEQNAALIKTQFPVDADLHAISVLPQSRAIENEVFFVVANAAGTLSSGTYSERLCGYSSIASPLYGTLAILSNHEEGCLIQELHMDLLKDSAATFSVRETAPALSP
ncbi:MAG: carbon-nitrogen hydrolase family protein [Candidatus Aenigmarchaeota archaeon]|nr:carbon-nitrogen hydrolase family protein [Candidatus Aenigmarchaeota archaeon]